MGSVWLIQLFWFALALPGYALVRRWDEASLQRGFLFGLGRCYLASFALLTPLAVLGYWRNWPLWPLSCGCVLGVVIGAAVLVRDRRTLVAALRRPSWLAAVSCVLIGFDLWLGLRAGAHTQGDAGYHIARVRMLLVDGLSNWDPIVAQPRLDIIYHTNLYHALIAVSGQLTGSDAAVAWLATWPFAKLLVAAGVGQLACCVFGTPAAGWIASLGMLVSQCAYSALPFPNTLAPIALLPMGLCAATELWSSPQRAPRAAAWLAASAMALAQMHALNAIFLAMIVGPVLLAVLVMRALLRARQAPLEAGPSWRVLVCGMLACVASLPWLVVAGAPRMQVLFQLALPTLQHAAPLPQPNERTQTSLREDLPPPEPAQHSEPATRQDATQPAPHATAEQDSEPATRQDPTQPAPPATPAQQASEPATRQIAAQPAPPVTPAQRAPAAHDGAKQDATADSPARLDLPTREAATQLAPAAQAEPETREDVAPAEDAPLPAAEPEKVVYKADRFRKLDNGLSVYEPGKLRGPFDANLILLGVVAISLALGPRRQLGVLAVLVAMTCAWLLVPALCSVLLFVTGAPWAALRIAQVLPFSFYVLVPAAPLFWLSRTRLSSWTKRAELPLAAAAMAIGSLQISHGEPWTPERLWEHASSFDARTQWDKLAARQSLLCGPIPKGEVVMAHPRWDYGLPMLCRNSVIALAPGRGWHGLAYMHERRADVDEFFHEHTSGARRLELMRKYQARYVYTSQRIARRIVRSSPKTSKILAQTRLGAVLEIDTQGTHEAGD